MSYPLLTFADFSSGPCRISQNKSIEDMITSYIAEYEQCYLQDLLGCELEGLLIADLDIDNNPQTQRFIDIWDPFCLDDNVCKGERKSKGILHLLKCFIFFEVMRDIRFKHTTTGIVVNVDEVARQTGASEHISVINKRFNDSVESYRAIQNKIKVDLLYPEYKGIEKEYLLW